VAGTFLVFVSVANVNVGILIKGGCMGRLEDEKITSNVVDVSSRLITDKMKAPVDQKQSTNNANTEVLELNIPNELMKEVKDGSTLVISSVPHQYKLTLTSSVIRYVNQKQQKKIQYNLTTNQMLLNDQPAENHNTAIQNFSKLLNTIGQHCIKRQATVKKER
jgi:hypothetical protein